MYTFISTKKQLDMFRKRNEKKRQARIAKAEAMETGYRERIFAKLDCPPPPQPKPIKITLYADALLRRHEPLPAQVKPRQQDYSDHQFEPTYIGHLWEPAGERRFEDFERSYNGVQRKLETGNLTHDLTTLIRTRG